MIRTEELATAVRWRSLSPRHWVARRDGRHLGAIERGRRWIATDARSEPLGAFRTFAEAQAAVQGERRGPGIPLRTPLASADAVALVVGLSASMAALLAVWPLSGL